jgi:hypothetical protein
MASLSRRPDFSLYYILLFKLFIFDRSLSLYKKRITRCFICYGKLIYIGKVRGSNPGGGRDFQYPSRPALGPTQPPERDIGSLSRG